MPFGYVVSLDLEDRLAVVVGGGPVALARIGDLRDAGARVRVISPSPISTLSARAAADPNVDLHERPYGAGDLGGATLAVATGEDPFDVDAFWDESRERHVLTSVLDDLDHADFAAPALMRSGPLRIAIATEGRAPAFARRLRQHLESTLGQTAGELVDALAEARRLAGPREVPFDEWAARWERALHDLDGLLDRVRAGRAGEIVRDTVAILAGGAPAQTAQPVGRDDAGPP